MVITARGSSIRAARTAPARPPTGSSPADWPPSTRRSARPVHESESDRGQDRECGGSAAHGPRPDRGAGDGNCRCGRDCDGCCPARRERVRCGADVVAEGARGVARIEHVPGADLVAAVDAGVLVTDSGGADDFDACALQGAYLGVPAVPARREHQSGELMGRGGGRRGARGVGRCGYRQHACHRCRRCGDACASESLHAVGTWPGAFRFPRVDVTGRGATSSGRR